VNRKAISTLISGAPRLFYTAKKTELTLRYLLGPLFEPDFLAISRLVDRQRRLSIVDVGANIGQSAIDFGQLFRKARIHSFEANPSLESFLKLTGTLLGPRFHYDLVGLSDAPGTMDIYVPRRHDVHIYGEASLHPAQFDDAITRARIGEFTLDHFPVRVSTLDQQGLASVDILKIDVQGHELHVLQGARETIQREHPLIIFERSPADSLIIDYLQSMHSYTAMAPRDGSLRPVHEVSEHVNVVMLP
jgi:FkbM family methyltransferase